MLRWKEISFQFLLPYYSSYGNLIILVLKLAVADCMLKCFLKDFQTF